MSTSTSRGVEYCTAYRCYSRLKGVYLEVQIADHCNSHINKDCYSDQQFTPLNLHLSTYTYSTVIYTLYCKCRLKGVDLEVYISDHCKTTVVSCMHEILITS